ncbi:hypothetical protein ACVBIL_05940 [Shewanella sp. 125m-7]
MPAVEPSGNLLRHDYLIVDDEIFSFGPEGNMLLSQGKVADNESLDNGLCQVISESEVFDNAVRKAAGEIGEPMYNVYAYPLTTPHLFGARNCQTWVDDVLDRASEIYKESQ